MANQCYRCKYLERYFVKGLKRFNKTHLGRCIKKKETVSIHDCCDEFSCRSNQRPRKFAHYYLNDILCELSSLREVLENESVGIEHEEL